MLLTVHVHVLTFPSSLFSNQSDAFLNYSANIKKYRKLYKITCTHTCTLAYMSTANQIYVKGFNLHWWAK